MGTCRARRCEDALVTVAPLKAHPASPRCGGDGVGSSEILAACSGVNIARVAGGKAQRDSVGARGAEPGSDASRNSSFGHQPPAGVTVALPPALWMGTAPLALPTGLAEGATES